MPRIAAIGAPPPSLASPKKLRDAGLDPVAFEQNAELGGNWLFAAQPSSVYQGTHSSVRLRVGGRAASFFGRLRARDLGLVAPGTGSNRDRP
jgi:hypothetical protein